MLAELLKRFAQEYVYERGKAFAGSEFANFVRNDIAKEAKKHLIFLPFELKVKASVGAGNWAAVPWLGFFDPIITTSATRGFYVVYLVNAQTAEIFLSMNQGTTELYQEFGETRGREVLRRRAIDIADRVPEYADFFDREEIGLGSTEALPAGYAAGHSFGRKYDSENIDQNKFSSDLEKMLFAYEALIDRGGTTPTDVMISESDSQTMSEARRYTLARRIERSRHVRQKVLSKIAPVCQACGLDPVLDYSYSGRPENTPLDVHHSKPLFGLSEGETRRYVIPNDFLVLCPTCHRTIHSQDDPSDLEQLKRKIKFVRRRRKT